jgi:anti-sigma-K factor RskA
MDSELTPAEIDDLLAAYSIDAVDDDERAAVEEYLARNPDARADVGDLQRAASYLAYAGGPPPPGVWEQLETKLVGGEPGEPPPPPRLLPRARAAQPPSQTWRWVAAAAVVAALVFATLWLVSRDDGNNANNLAALAASAQHQSGARHANLVDPDGNVLARAVVLHDGTGYLKSVLPALAAGRTYQLWGLGGNAPVSLGVIGRNPDVVAFHAAGRPDKLAVTDEPAGGVAAPSQAPAAVGDVT